LGLLSFVRLTNPRQLFAAQHIHHAQPADAAPQVHLAGMLCHHLADDRRVLAEWMRAQRRQGTELEFVIMVIAVSCVKLLSAHNSTQHTSRKHKV
jgi:hypothetical protein